MISNRNSQYEITMGSTSGSTPHLMPEIQRPPQASTASIGPRSELSIASVASLPRVPTEWSPIARAPAQGPSPVTASRITATMSSGTDRMALKSWRTGIRIHSGATLLAARNASGNDKMAAMTVPTQAM